MSGVSGIRTKMAPCPRCCPADPADPKVYRSCFEAGTRYPDGGERVLVWRCSNCGYEMPRREVSRSDRTEMTPSQAAAVERLRARERMLFSNVILSERVEFVGRSVLWFARSGSANRDGAIPLLDRCLSYKVGPNGKTTDLNEEGKS